MSHNTTTKQQLDALTLCEALFEDINLDTSLFKSNKEHRNTLIDDLKKHPDWKLKWSQSCKRFKLGDDKHNYRDFLPKKTTETLIQSTLKQYENKLYFLNDKKLIKEGGDPLIPEIDGGLSLKFIFCNLKNSGTQKDNKKKVPPLYFDIADDGRNISNMFLRVYRIINNC
tara:strand:+ start:487 stop:996 length:510 start_codon:yes stop_codon:yes gene_type:complete